MTAKAYIVANEQQEHEVLEKLEREGFTWLGGENLTDNKPSNWFNVSLIYVIFVENNTITWNFLHMLEDEEIVFDGRKEEHMSEKYVVSQKFMTELEEWEDTLESSDDEYEHFVGIDKLTILPDVVFDWRYIGNVKERNNRLIAILRWVNGEDVFEIEKPKKWVVRSKEPQGSVDGEPLYIWFVDELTLEIETEATMPPYIRRFNTKEEAQSWANAHQEVVEVEE